jgi:hypothetical protein
MIDKEPPFIFQTKDRDGRLISCSCKRWLDHICDPFEGHEYLLDSQEDIQEFIQAIQNKDEINGILIDRDYNNRLIYLQKSKRGNYYNRVVVEFDDSSFTGDGFVVTAFQPVNMRDGDKPLWKK